MLGFVPQPQPTIVRRQAINSQHIFSGVFIPQMHCYVLGDLAKRFLEKARKSDFPGKIMAGRDESKDFGNLAGFFEFSLVLRPHGGELAAENFFEISFECARSAVAQPEAGAALTLIDLG